MKDCHDLYWKCDVLLLADAFEKFGNNSLTNYGLYPSHYLSAPVISWDALLNMTKMELKVVSDLDMYILFEKYIRGEVSYISPRHSTWNKYLEPYDPKQELKQIIYL